jgi:hypothetical protein
VGGEKEFMQQVAPDAYSAHVQPLHCESVPYHWQWQRHSSAPADHVATCYMTLQALSIYWQWGMLVLNLPMHKLIWDAFGGSQGTPTPSARPTGALSRLLQVTDAATGRAASLDCLLEAWDFKQTPSVFDIASNALFRAIARWEASLCVSCNQ